MLSERQTPSSTSSVIDHLDEISGSRLARRFCRERRKDWRLGLLGASFTDLRTQVAPLRSSRSAQTQISTFRPLRGRHRPAPDFPQRARRLHAAIRPDYRFHPDHAVNVHFLCQLRIVRGDARGDPSLWGGRRGTLPSRQAGGERHQCYRDQKDPCPHFVHSPAHLQLTEGGHLRQSTEVIEPWVQSTRTRRRFFSEGLRAGWPRPTEQALA